MTKDNLFIKLVIFTVCNNNLQIYLIKDKLPEEKFNGDLTLNQVAESIYKKTIGSITKDIYLEQLYTFNPQKILPVSVVYYILAPYAIFPDDKKVNLFKISDLSTNIADYEIIMYAVKRLRWKIEYTNVVYSLLPPEFTLGELQTIYETILGKNLDKRNFRRKILSLNLLKASGKKRRGVVARPAAVYEFKRRRPEIVKVF